MQGTKTKETLTEDFLQKIAAEKRRDAKCSKHSCSEKCFILEKHVLYIAVIEFASPKE